MSDWTLATVFNSCMHYQPATTRFARGPFTVPRSFNEYYRCQDNNNKKCKIVCGQFLRNTASQLNAQWILSKASAWMINISCKTHSTQYLGVSQNMINSRRIWYFVCFVGRFQNMTAMVLVDGAVSLAWMVTQARGYWPQNMVVVVVAAGHRHLIFICLLCLVFGFLQHAQYKHIIYMLKTKNAFMCWIELGGRIDRAPMSIRISFAFRSSVN